MKINIAVNILLGIKLRAVLTLSIILIDKRNIVKLDLVPHCLVVVYTTSFLMLAPLWVYFKFIFNESHISTYNLLMRWHYNNDINVQMVLLCLESWTSQWNHQVRGIRYHKPRLFSLEQLSKFPLYIKISCLLCVWMRTKQPWLFLIICQFPLQLT